MPDADLLSEPPLPAGPTPPARTRDAWVVLGMHRSGTSAMAKVLELSGGQGPLDPLAPSADNPLGYLESAAIMALNDDILAAGDAAWDDVFSGRPRPYLSQFDQALRRRAAEVVRQSFPGEGPLVLKDPRINVLAAFWDAALKAEGLRPCYLVMVRHPMEVAASLLARDGLPIEHGLLLWLDHMLAAERDTRDAPRAFVSFDALLEDWRGVLDDVERAWVQPFPRRTGLAGAQIAGFLRPALRHQHAGRGLPPPRGPLGATVSQAYEWFTAATRPQPPAHRDALDRASAWLDGLHEQFEPVAAHAKLRFGEVRGELDRYMAHAKALEGVRDLLEAELASAVAARDAHAAELAPLRIELDTRTEALACTRRELELQAADAAGLRAALDAAQGGLDDARARLGAQAGELERAQAIQDVRQAEMLQLRTLLDARTLELQHARSTLDAQTGGLAQGQAGLAAQLGELVAAATRNEATTAQASRVREAERDASLQRIRELEAEAARLDAEVQALRRAGQETDALYGRSLHTLRADFEQQAAELGTLPASFEEELQASEARYSALGDEMRRVLGLSRAADAQRRKLEGELAQAREAVSAEAAGRADAKDRLGAAEGALAQAREAVSAEAAGRADAQDRLGAAEGALAGETRRRAGAEARTRELEGQLDALRSALGAAQEEVGALRTERQGMLQSRAWRLATASHRWLTRRTA